MVIITIKVTGYHTMLNFVNLRVCVMVTVYNRNYAIYSKMQKKDEHKRGGYYTCRN